MSNTPEKALERIETCKRFRNTVLDLSKSSLTEIPDELNDEGLIHVTILHLNSNEISEIANLGELKNLKVLYLDSNRISEITNLDNLKKLEDLDLSINQISEIKNLDNLENLHVLYLSSNQINEIKNLNDLKNLHVLHLSSNQISEIKNLNNLKNLYTLDISSNKIAEIKNLDQLKNLQELNISLNHIKEIKNLSELKNLKELFFSANQIKEINNLNELWNLKKLNVSANQINEIKNLGDLKNLNNLNISANLINKIKNLNELKKLQELDISLNQINEIENLSELKNLQELNISSNQINEIKNLSELTSLKKLDIKKNNLKTIQPLLPFFRTNVKVELSGNPIVTPPKEVVEGGVNAIIDYFEQAKTFNLKPLNECKLIFVGDGEAGKTTLMKWLLFNKFLDGKTTHGINKINWKGIVNERSEQIRVNCWDFGGQHIQHSLHQFFFTERVVYVLVLNPRNDNNANYWLEQIEKLGCNSDVLIVYNWKKDDDKQASYLNNFYELRKRFPKISDPLLLNCKLGDGVKEFKELLIKTILQQEDLSASYPENWFNIKRDLEASVTLSKNYIEYKDYDTICSKYDYIDNVRKKRLLLQLDKIGSIVFFDKPILNSLQILNPDWITTGAYSVLTSELTKERMGHISYDDLRQIFKDPIEVFSDTKKTIHYTEQQFAFILELMFQYDLCQKNPFNHNEYLIPSAFVGKPNTNYSSYKENCRYYRFQFPSAFEMLIMHRFIARTIDMCFDNSYWQSGILLKHKHSETFALVETDLYSQQINFWIKGKEVREFWEVLRNHIKDICGIYKNFIPEEKVEYMKDGKKVFLSYEDMVRAYKNGIRVIQYDRETELTNLDVIEVIDYFEDSVKIQELSKKEGKVEIHMHSSTLNYAERDSHIHQINGNNNKLNMQNSKLNNPWQNGSFYLFIPLIELVGFYFVFKNLPIYGAVGLTLAVIILTTITGAFTLKNNREIDDKTFGNLMKLAFSKIYLLSDVLKKTNKEKQSNS